MKPFLIGFLAGSALVLVLPAWLLLIGAAGGALYLAKIAGDDWC